MEIGGGAVNFPADNRRDTSVIAENSQRDTNIIQIYPLSNYYFASKLALPLKNETISDRLARLNYWFSIFSIIIYLI